MNKGMHRMDIREEEYWKQFESSGRIEDYLSFVSSTRQIRQNRTGQAKEDHAGIYMGDRDHTEAVSGGRIR